MKDEGLGDKPHVVLWVRNSPIGYCIGAPALRLVVLFRRLWNFREMEPFWRKEVEGGALKVYRLVPLVCDFVISASCLATFHQASSAIVDSNPFETVSQTKHP